MNNSTQNAVRKYLVVMFLIAKKYIYMYIYSKKKRISELCCRVSNLRFHNPSNYSNMLHQKKIFKYAFKLHKYTHNRTKHHAIELNIRLIKTRSILPPPPPLLLRRFDFLMHLFQQMEHLLKAHPIAKEYCRARCLL